MTHNLFSERFYSHRQLPWHGLGRVSDNPESAVEAWSAMSPYIVEKKSLFFDLPYSGNAPQDQHNSGYCALVRLPVPDDPEYRTLGVVGPEYELVDPQQVCEIYDRVVRQPVETMASLGWGEMFLISTKLPEINVNGDDVENYLLVSSPYSGGEAMQVRATPVRVVCQNTLMAARRQTSELYSIVHTEGAADRLSDWMAGLYERAVRRVDTLKEFFVLLAGYTPATKTIGTIIEKIYPDPVNPQERPNAPKEVIDGRMENFEINLRYAKRNRAAVKELFDGRLTGFNDATKGTGWGLYNAVSEFESWRPTTRLEARAQSVVFGDRAQTIERAYSTILDYAVRAK